MRPDQIASLRDLSEKLTDALLLEMDPDEWPGAGMTPTQMDQATRGDRYWCKKNAVATLTALTKTVTLLGTAAPAGVPPEGDGETLDDEITRAEKEAERALRKIQDKAAKSAL